MKTLTALEVRKKFGSVLDMVAKKHIHVAISRANQTLAVMIPADEYRVRNIGREKRLRLAAGKIDEWKELNAAGLKRIDTVKLLRESREQR